MVYRTIACSCVFLTFGFADTLHLRGGATIQGNYAGGDARQVKMMVGDHVETYQIEEVSRVEFGGEGGQAGGPAMPAATPPAPPSPQERGERSYRLNDAPPQMAGGMDIPAGTNLVVRMIEGVDSERDSLGKIFRASIDEPVMVNGQTVIPRGANVTLKLVNQRESGKFTGTTALTLALTQVEVNGRLMDVTTSEVTQASSSRGSRTAKTVGGGAVAGAVLGGIFGGGKGAAIGAASGGAVGAGAEVMTKGQRVKIPSETRLSFLLQQPLRP